MKSNLPFSADESVENEIKLALSDAEETQRQLKLLGAELIRRERQRDTYFVRPHKPIEDENIRVREVIDEGDAVWGYFTYKSPLDANARFLKREEIETRVDNPQSVMRILDSLGYTVIDRIEKARTFYKLGSLEIGVDFIEGLGYFIEIEGEDAEITSLSRQLDLNPDDAINKSYSALRDERRAGGTR